jgi:NADP-dependent 3-hydroxy acid dehydrogenase YdfG
MIDINVKACVCFESHHPNDRKKSGHIINIGSTAAKEANGNVYATKHAVDALNQGMRMDLNPFGIRGCHPGMVQLNLVKCALKEIRIEPKSIPRVHTLQPEDMPTLFTLWYRDRIMSILPI